MYKHKFEIKVQIIIILTTISFVCKVYYIFICFSFNALAYAAN